MALPMGAMGVVAGFVISIAGGINFGDALSPTGSAADLGRAESLVQLAAAFLFFGMGLILVGTTMRLADIVRRLRDAGRDVQKALAVEPLQLPKPLTGKLTPPLMMGAIVEVAAFRFQGDRNGEPSHRATVPAGG